MFDVFLWLSVQRYLEENGELLDALRPDVVVGDVQHSDGLVTHQPCRQRLHPAVLHLVVPEPAATACYGYPCSPCPVDQ